MSAETPTGPIGAPEPPEVWFIEQGWTRRDAIWWKPNGQPVFFVDTINAYAPLRAWLEKRTKCCRDGSCPPRQ